MNLLLLGPQGSGKGTQAQRISQLYGVPHVSTGDMFRAAIADGSPLGDRVGPILAAGELVPDELTVELIRERLGRDDARSGFVLDGFPRTLGQAAALDASLSEIERALDRVLFFDVDDAVATERLLGRARDEGRSDDTREVIARRLAVYHEQTEPLVHRYHEQGLLARIPAERSVDEVFAEIRAALGEPA